MSGSRMDPDDLRRALGAARDKARGIAATMVRGLREPRPSPDDLVNAAIERILASARRNPESIVHNPEAYLVRTLGNVLIDLGRRRAHEPSLPAQLPNVPAPPPDVERARRELAFACAFGQLEPREQCVLTRVHLNEPQLTVPRGFEACGWTTKSPFFEHRKLKDKFKGLFEQCMEAV